MKNPTVQRITSARIPTRDGEFRLVLYENSLDDKEHLALIYGDITNEDNVLVRIHSECFTGDVLGSLRCDCGEQLNTSMRVIAEHGAGVILYLRQEGRGIGLRSKLQAYNLQDEGYDTVEANLALGHDADERDYTIGALMLEELGINAVRLLTNNPEKIESLEAFDITVTERVPLQPHLNRHNTRYLRTKVERMRHMLELGPQTGRRTNPHGEAIDALRERMHDHYRQTGQPFVTLSYAQSLNGSIAARGAAPLAISSADSMAFADRMRAAHDATLVGIGTLLADDPQITMRLADGNHPQPVVLDTKLRLSPSARLLDRNGPRPIVATNQEPRVDRFEALVSAGAEVLRLPCDGLEGISLPALLDALGERGIRSLMVEGDREVITSFIRHQLVHHVVVTVAPVFVGGMSAVSELVSAEDGTDGRSEKEFISAFSRLTNVSYQWLGRDLVIQGDPSWDASRGEAG